MPAWCRNFFFSHQVVAERRRHRNPSHSESGVERIDADGRCVWSASVVHSAFCPAMEIEVVYVVELPRSVADECLSNYYSLSRRREDGKWYSLFPAKVNEAV